MWSFCRGGKREESIQIFQAAQEEELERNGVWPWHWSVLLKMAASVAWSQNCTAQWSPLQKRLLYGDHWLFSCIAKSRVEAWHSECRTGEMDDVEKSWLPGASQTKWNFHSCAVSSLYDHTQPASRFQTIRDSDDFGKRQRHISASHSHSVRPWRWRTRCGISTPCARFLHFNSDKITERVATSMPWLVTIIWRSNGRKFAHTWSPCQCSAF